MLLYMQQPHHPMQHSERLHMHTSERDYKDQGSNQSYDCFKYISLFFHPKPTQNTKPKKTHTPKPVIYRYSTDFFSVMNLPNPLSSWKRNPSISTYVLWKQCLVITEQSSTQGPIRKLLLKNFPHFSLAVYIALKNPT